MSVSYRQVIRARINESDENRLFADQPVIGGIRPGTDVPVWLSRLAIAEI